MRTIIALALVAAALPAAGQAQEPDDIIIRGGEADFVYEKRHLSPQTYRLQGRFADGRWFRLSVKGQRVSGDVDGMPVYFRVARPATLLAVLSNPMLDGPA